MLNTGIARATSGAGWWRCVLALVLAALVVPGCGKSGSSSASSAGSSGDASAQAGPTPPPNAVPILFTYGSEKKAWIGDVTATFNAAGKTTASGKPIFVTAIPEGSGECIDEILAERRKPDLTSPASAAFVKLGNAQSRTKTGGDLLASTDNLVLSPVVIAMWKPMAEAMGWGTKPVGWADVLALAKNPEGWSAYGHPEWGRFKFGHTHPEYSNSGLISTIAMVYAATGKVNGLTLADVNADATAQFVGDIESAVPHYGSSTGFFYDKMVPGGPQYLSAAVLYESLVIDSYNRPDKPSLPMVAIYPKEGTFWSDHPIGIVQRDWVTPEHREAAKVYIDYLLAEPQQQKALQYGFRPGNPQVQTAAPIDAAHGVDPAEPKTTLEVPSADITGSIINLWRTKKKAANLVLVFDCSGSMNDEGKMTNARPGAQQLIALLDDNDALSLLPFSTNMNWAGKNLSMRTARAVASARVGGFIADGGTRLYDSIAAAYDFLKKSPNDGRIAAIVVLTDGEDTQSQMSLDQLIHKLRPSSEDQSVRVFTIGYGADAKADVLGKIADVTHAKFYKGTPENIREVFKEIATFF